MREDSDVIGRPHLPWLSPPAGPSVTSARRSPTRIGGKYRVASKAKRAAPRPAIFESGSVPRLSIVPHLRGRQGSSHMPIDNRTLRAVAECIGRRRSDRLTDQRLPDEMSSAERSPSFHRRRQRSVRSAVGGEGGGAAWDSLRHAVHLGTALRTVGRHRRGVRCRAVSRAAWDSLRHAVHLGTALCAVGRHRRRVRCRAVSRAAWDSLRHAVHLGTALCAVGRHRRRVRCRAVGEPAWGRAVAELGGDSRPATAPRQDEPGSDGGPPQPPGCPNSCHELSLVRRSSVPHNDWVCAFLRAIRQRGDFVTPLDEPRMPPSRCSNGKRAHANLVDGGWGAAQLAQAGLRTWCR